jgi:hypothetical protein
MKNEIARHRRNIYRHIGRIRNDVARQVAGFSRDLAQAAGAPGQAAAGAANATDAGHDRATAATTAPAAAAATPAASATAAAMAAAMAAAATAGKLQTAAPNVLPVEQMECREADVGHFLFAKNKALVGKVIVALRDVGSGQCRRRRTSHERETQSGGTQHGGFARALLHQSLLDLWHGRILQKFL